MIVGRNDQCPCGSGKKYKKCCLGREDQFVKQTEQSKYGLHLTYEEVNEMSTVEIVDKLGKLGVPFKKEKFLEDIERFYSAEDLSENWFRIYNLTITGRDEDFPWIAAWILWERMAPTNRLSMEQMDDLIESGFKDLDARDSISCCNKWLLVWEALKERINPQYNKLDYLEKHYSGSFFLSNFVQDLEMELLNAGLMEPAYFEKRISYCREFCDFFPKESKLIIHNMRRAITDSYVRINQYEKAELEFEKLVQEFPENPWGYIGWGDAYFFGEKKDFNRAKKLYEKALDVAKDKMDIMSIKERLEDLLIEME